MLLTVFQLAQIVALTKNQFYYHCKIDIAVPPIKVKCSIFLLIP